MNLRKVSQRETQDDFDYESPNKIKLIEYDGDSYKMPRPDNLSEDDSPEKSLSISPTKKRMFCKNSLLLPGSQLGSNYKQKEIQEILEQSAHHNDIVREMREEVMTTRKEVG